MTHQIPLEPVDDRRRSTAIVNALGQFRDALASRHTDPLGRENVRRSLHALCATARAVQAQPEYVLVRLKSALDDLPELNRLSADHRTERKAAIVSLAIEVYFGDDHGDAE